MRKALTKKPLNWYQLTRVFLLTLLMALAPVPSAEGQVQDRIPVKVGLVTVVVGSGPGVDAAKVPGELAQGETVTVLIQLEQTAPLKDEKIIVATELGDPFGEVRSGTGESSFPKGQTMGRRTQIELPQDFGRGTITLRGKVPADLRMKSVFEQVFPLTVTLSPPVSFEPYLVLYAQGKSPPYTVSSVSSAPGSISGVIAKHPIALMIEKDWRGPGKRPVARIQEALNDGDIIRAQILYENQPESPLAWFAVGFLFGGVVIFFCIWLVRFRRKQATAG